jgi:enoyl-CoA hydratase/carnithine racemase
LTLIAALIAEPRRDLYILGRNRDMSSRDDNPKDQTMTIIAERVSIEVEGGIADVRLIRGAKMNALDTAMFDALLEAGDRLAGQAGLRAVVLSGEGAAFCAGLDLGMLAGMTRAAISARLAQRNQSGANVFQNIVLIWRALPVPVIAAVHGVAFGGGFQLMLGADLRLVEPETKLSVMEVRWGLAPDMGGTLLMRGLARDDIIRELSFTGRIFSGREALEYGLATRLAADPRSEALALARDVAAKSPDAVRAIKALLASAAVNDPAAQLRAEAEAQIRLLAGRNHAEAVAAGLAKRAPVFED